METQKWNNNLSISNFSHKIFRTRLSICRPETVQSVCQFWIQAAAIDSSVWYCTATLDANRFHHKEKEVSRKWRPDYNDRSLGRLIHQFASLAYFNISDINVKHCEDSENAAWWRCKLDKLVLVNVFLSVSVILKHATLCSRLKHLQCYCVVTDKIQPRTKAKQRP